MLQDLKKLYQNAWFAPRIADRLAADRLISKIHIPKQIMLVNWPAFQSLLLINFDLYKLDKE